MLKLKEKIKNTFTDELPADLIQSNQTRQVLEAAFSYVNPIKPKNPSLIHVSIEVAESLGISKEETKLIGGQENLL